MEITELVSNVGFPIALAIYLLKREHDNNERVVNALQSATEVAEASNEIIKDATEAINDARYTLKEVRDILTLRGASGDRGN